MRKESDIEEGCSMDENMLIKNQCNTKILIHIHRNEILNAFCVVVPSRHTQCPLGSKEKHQQRL